MQTYVHMYRYLETDGTEQVSFIITLYLTLMNGYHNYGIFYNYCGKFCTAYVKRRGFTTFVVIVFHSCGAYYMSV